MSNGYIHSIQTPITTFRLGDELGGVKITEIIFASEDRYFGLGGMINGELEQIGRIYSKEAVVEIKYN